MRVTVLELPATWGAPNDALDVVDRALGDGPATDLVLLPEAALTGYVSPEGVFDPSPFAEPADGATVLRAQAIARRHAVHLVIPLVLGEGERISNAAVVVAPGGEPATIYRKRHPWFPESWATPGEEQHPVVRIGDLNATIAICYDGHFLRDEAKDALTRSDLLLFPSAWVDETDSREPLLRSLAREFGVAVANANWGPGIVRVRGQGGSVILDPAGLPLARVAPGDLRADAVVSQRMSEACGFAPKG